MRSSAAAVLIALACWTAPFAKAQPTLSLVGSPIDYGLKVGFNVAINWNDALTASGYFRLDATGTMGSTIQQQNAFGSVVINTESDANLFATLDPNYRKNEDSWWRVGPDMPFASPTPPYTGVANGSGNVGSNLFQASYGTAPNVPVSGSTNILSLVLDQVGGRATGNVSGIVSRAGFDYPVNLNLFYEDLADPGISLQLSTTQLNYGTLRIGTTSTQELLASNGGDTDGLQGSYGGAPGDFSPHTPLSFGPLAAGAAAAPRSYVYSPSNHGADNATVTVTSNATFGQPNQMVSLSGVGVGPAFDSSRSPGSTINFDLSLLSGSSQGLTVSNISTDSDGGFASKTNLTLKNVALTGPDAASFSITSLSNGQVLAKGESTPGSIGIGASRNYRPHVATLRLATDEGAPLGGDGADYVYEIVAAPRFAGVWQGLTGGAWESPANWSLGTLPAASSTARFSLEGNYTVSLANNRNQAGLIVTNDNVRIDLNARTLALSGNLLVGNLATSLGILTLEDGTVSAATVQVSTTATAIGSVHVAAGGVLQAGSAYVGGSNLAAGGIGSAVVAAGGSLSTTGAIKVWPAGTLHVDGAATIGDGLDLAGTLQGGGAISGIVFNGGLVAPIGDLDIGYYVQTPSGRLSIDLGPTSNDSLDVTNVAIFTGGLEIHFADDFQPSYGDVFEVLRYGSHTGKFSTISGGEYAPGKSLMPVYSATSLKLYAVTIGDGNGDGLVTAADYTIWADHFGQGPGATPTEGDYNLDGFVNGADYTLWADSYTGLPPAGPIAVPEPTGAALAGLALVAFVRSYWRRVS